MSPLYAFWLSLLAIYMVITGRAEIVINRLSTIGQKKDG